MNQDAVSSVVGSILLVAITVVMVGGLAIVVFSIEGPSDTVRADLEATVTRGPDGAWGTGDELVRVIHRSGEAVPREGITIKLTIDNAASLYSGTGLTGGFTDGWFSLGESWSVTKTILTESEVQVDIYLIDGSSSRLLLGGTLRSGTDCSTDTVAPVATAWGQSPADITTLSTGAVTVTVDFQDFCNAVDPAVDPTLYYRVNDGSGPAWTDGGTMSAQGGGSWTGTIPDQTWLLQLGQTLQYYVGGVQDTVGNSGDTGVQGDIIQLLGGSQVYADSHTETTGTTADFAALQAEGDGQEATLTEAASTGTGTFHATVAVGSGVVSPDNALGAADDAWTSGIDNSGDSVTVSSFDVTSGSGTISQVQFRIEAHYENLRFNDDIDLEAYVDGGWVVLSDAFLPNAGTDATFTFDITGLKAAWTWTNIQDLQFRATYDKNAGTDPMVLFVDSMYVQITVGGPSYAMDIELGFPTPGAGSNVLELRYHVAGDTFHVEVYDGVLGTWTTRGATLFETTASQWVYTFTATEAGPAIAPRIRFVDDTPTGAAQGSLQLDYARVVTV